MKRQLYKLAKQAGLEITYYKFTRSDMGPMCYEVRFIDRPKFEDWYPFGSGKSGKDALIERFKKHIQET